MGYNLFYSDVFFMYTGHVRTHMKIYVLQLVQSTLHELHIMLSFPFRVNDIDRTRARLTASGMDFLTLKTQL